MKNRVIAAMSGLAVAALTMAAPAQFGPDFWEPREQEDGSVIAGDYYFEDWIAYYSAENFYELNATYMRERSRALWSAQLGVDPADCDADFNNPSDIYAVGQILYVPTVVHNITRFNGTTGFISDEDIATAIDMLNDDFAGVNGGVDTGIRFFLAFRDPIERPTNGVDRCCNNECENIPCDCCRNSLWFEEQEGEEYWLPAAWLPNQYMNIYTTRANADPERIPDDEETPDIDESTLGLGYVPFRPQIGPVGDRSDRVVVSSFFFGPNPAVGYPYDENHVLTHQVGHYLGLINTYAGCGKGGPAACNSEGDLICETAPQSEPTFPAVEEELEFCDPQVDPECGFPKNSSNFMDLASDQCRFGFTEEQARRMRCTLLTWRSSLWVTEDESMRPEGDICQAAPPLQLGNMGVSNMLASTEDVTNPTACAPDDIKPPVPPAQWENDLWFEWTTDEAGILDVRACLATQDTELAVYENCPTTLFTQPIACDTIGCEGFANVIVTIAPGTYYVRLATVEEPGNITLQTTFSSFDDCNGNLIPDDEEIAMDQATDCDENGVPDECQGEQGFAWASSVVDFSTEMSSTDNAAAQALGEPDVFLYADSPNAWSSVMNGSVEMIELGYDPPLYADSVLVRQSWGAGSVRRIDLIDESDNVINVFDGVDPSPGGDIADFLVSFPRTDVPIASVRIEVDTDHNLSEAEQIDAVRLGGTTVANDCNNNGFDDLCDIELGDSDDCYGNGVPDECDPDCNDNGVVDACETAKKDCDGNGVPDECETVTFPQFVDSVINFSSQFSTPDYAAEQATGTPDVFAYGDSPLAWVADVMNGTRETLSLGIAQPVFASSVTIRETWGAGSVAQVDVIDEQDNLHTVWVGEDPSPPGAIANFTVTFPRTMYLVKGVRITVDTDANLNEWEEIDSVIVRGATSVEGDCNGNGLIDGCESLPDCNENGVPDECEVGATDQFASEVRDFSTQFSASDYAATQTLLGPDVFAYGDNPLAWVAANQDDTMEFVTVGFDRPVFSNGVTVRETWGNGFVAQVDVIDLNDNVITVWNGIDPSQPGSVVDFRASWPRTDFLVDGVVIHVDTNATAVWEEIDAIMLHGVEPGVLDNNDNGIPDDCEPNLCPADCSPDNGDGTFGNGVVNIDDLLAVVDSFGGDGGPCDISPDNGDGTFGNGVINIDDLLGVIDSFGPCE